MLSIGTQPTKSCAGMTRRSFVTAAATLPLLGTVPNLARASVERQRARSVVMVWLWGGPSHLDTFDPKPDAIEEIRGPFATIPTRTPGVHFTELLPQLAHRFDKFAVVRSCRFSGNHDMLVLTGDRREGASQEPNFGSIVARRHKTVGVPPFVSVMPQTSLRHGFQCNVVPGHHAGRLGAAYHPFFVSCSADAQVEIPSLQLIEGLTPDRLADRRLLVRQVDRLQRTVNSPEMAAFDQQNDGAFTMLTSRDAVRAFDLSAEDERMRGSYGHTTFGQSMLLARRLVEAGIPYIHVNWSLGVDGLAEGAQMGWDTHRNGFGQLMNYHCPVFDRAMSALLDDLDARGLLQETLVVATGEMGRTPKINDHGGRDHWATCSTLWAGAGIEGGRVIGATDATGAEPVTEPVSALMVGTTIAEAVGIDSQGRAEMNVLKNGKIIDGLL